MRPLGAEAPVLSYTTDVFYFQKGPQVKSMEGKRPRACDNRPPQRGAKGPKAMVGKRLFMFLFKNQESRYMLE